MSRRFSYEKKPERERERMNENRTAPVMRIVFLIERIDLRRKETIRY